MLLTTSNIHGVTRIEVGPSDPLTISGTDTRKIVLYTPEGRIEITAFGPPVPTAIEIESHDR